MKPQSHPRKPLVFSTLSDVETPISLFAKLSDGEPTAFLLESTEGDSRLARYSFIGLQPLKTFHFKQGQGILTDHRLDRIETITITNPLDILQRELQHISADFLPPDASIPFAGGWVGYMGYGATRYFDGIPQQTEDPQNVPEGSYGLYDTVILFDHLYRRILLVSYQPEAEANAFWNRILSRLAQAKPLPLLSCMPEDSSNDHIYQNVQGPFSKERFCKLVEQGKAYIQEGQIFQIVLSHRFTLPVSAPPITTYRMIQALNPSPYSYYLQFPGFTYLGSSPETFVKCYQGEVTLRALAGTRPRGQSEPEDQSLEAELRSNEKELAEHRMLVDLGRNDLGRVCQVGTIRVGELATLTRYTNVMHLATEITGKLRDDKTAFNVFQGCFPRGTVTGAPKIRAMRLLSELEPEQRGIYSGVVGYFDFSGNMDAAIAIRSVLIKDGLAHVNAGAGVVYDSDPEAEYEETRNKAKSILQAVQLAEKALSQSVSVNPTPQEVI